MQQCDTKFEFKFVDGMHSKLQNENLFKLFVQELFGSRITNLINTGQNQNFGSTLIPKLEFK